MTRALFRVALVAALLILPWFTLSAEAQPSAGNRACTFQSTATAVGNGTACEVLGYTVLAVQVSGTVAGTLVPEGSMDGTNYTSLYCMSVPSLQIGIGQFTVIGTYWCKIPGYRLARVRVGSAGGTTSVSASGQAYMGSFATNWP